MQDFRRVSDLRFSGQTRTADFVATLEKKSWWYFVSSKSFHTNFNNSYPYLRMVPDNLWSTEREQAVTPPQSPSLDSFL